MSSLVENSVRKRVQKLANEYGISPATVCGRAFKNSRKFEQLKRRDEQDQASLHKLDLLAEVLRKEAEKKQDQEGLEPSGFAIDYKSNTKTNLDHAGNPIGFEAGKQ